MTPTAKIRLPHDAASVLAACQQVGIYPRHTPCLLATNDPTRPYSEWSIGTDEPRICEYKDGRLYQSGHLVWSPAAAPQDSFDPVGVLRAALTDTIAWMWDPDADPTEQFEQVAAVFYRDTGHLRPGKSDPMAMTGSPEDRAQAWEVWRHQRAREVLANMRAALAATEEK